MKEYIFVPSTLSTKASEALEKEIAEDLNRENNSKTIAQLLQDDKKEQENTNKETDQKTE